LCGGGGGGGGGGSELFRKALQAKFDHGCVCSKVGNRNDWPILGQIQVKPRRAMLKISILKLT